MFKVPLQGSNKHVNHPATVARRSDVITLVGLVCERSTCAVSPWAHPWSTAAPAGDISPPGTSPCHRPSLAIQPPAKYRPRPAYSSADAVIALVITGLKKRQSCEMWDVRYGREIEALLPWGCAYALPTVFSCRRRKWDTGSSSANIRLS